MIINPQNKTVNLKRRYGAMSRKEVMVALVATVLAVSLVGGVLHANPGVTPPRSDDLVFVGITVGELAACGQMDPTMFAKVITGEIPAYAVCVNPVEPTQSDDTIPDYLKGYPDGMMDPTMFAQIITGEIPQ
jgi:hypothetical protein